MKKLIFIVFITLLSCSERVDCDFDLKTTSYYMVKTNGDDWFLKESGYKVVDGSKNYVKGDTCYLKHRAYMFWQNDERGTLSIYEQEKIKLRDSINELKDQIKKDSLYSIIKTGTKNNYDGTYDLQLTIWIRSLDRSKNIEYSDYKYNLSKATKNRVQKNMILKAKKIKSKIDKKLESKNEINLKEIRQKIKNLKNLQVIQSY